MDKRTTLGVWESTKKRLKGLGNYTSDQIINILIDEHLQHVFVPDPDDFKIEV